MRLKPFYHWNRTGRLVCMLKGEQKSKNYLREPDAITVA